MSSVSSNVAAGVDYGWLDLEPTSAHRYLTPAVISALEKYLRPGATVLDIGCGNGYLAAKVSARGMAVTAVDASPDGIRLAQTAYPAVRFLVGSVYEDGWLEAMPPMDAVVATEVLEHLYRPRALLQTARLALKPGGLLVVTVPYHGYVKNLALSVFNAWDHHLDPFWDGGHIKLFSKRTLTKMLVGEGFGVRTVQGVGRIPSLWKSLVVASTAIP